MEINNNFKRRDDSVGQAFVLHFGDRGSNPNYDMPNSSKQVVTAGARQHVECHESSETL